MKYQLIILGSATTSQAPSTALHFAHALLAQGHQLERAFFYRNGVDTSIHDIGLQWATLAAKHGFELIYCVASAQRRGLNDQPALIKGFEIGGLGLYAEGLINADKVVHFG